MCVCVCVFTHVPYSPMCVSAKASVVSSSATPRTVAHQAPLSMGFLRQDWGGLLRPPLGNLPDLGIKLTCRTCTHMEATN